MSAAITGFAEAIATSSYGQWASGSALAYPVANVVHLLGLVMLVGAIGIVDLRLAGAFRAVPVAPLYRSLRPVAIAGLVVIVPSGATMFASDAVTFASSAVFRWKISLIAVAVTNVAAFHILWRNRIDNWDAAPPVVGRLMAAASVMLWLTIGALGRMIAYSRSTRCSARRPRDACRGPDDSRLGGASTREIPMRFMHIFGALLMTATAQTQPTHDWKLVIHGGAGVIEKAKITPEREKAIRGALDHALASGSKILAGGGTALDAVEVAVRELEDDPNFNAGRGAVFTYDGVNELDASIMDGRTRAAGAVTGVSTSKNPISLARKVMEESEHVFLSGDGADQFAREHGLEQVPNAYFATPERRRQLEELKTKKVSALEVEYKYGTVGAVALDGGGHLAAATSTGGMTGKRWGRIGDSPIIGAGTYADDRACAVSATGWGEYFIRAGVAHEICARMRLTKAGGQEAADGVMAEVKALGGDGGVIVVTPQGEMVTSFNTPGMYRGMADAKGRKVGLYSEAEER